MFCPSCGQPHNSESLFCPNCGQKLQVSVDVPSSKLDKLKQFVVKHKFKFIISFSVGILVFGLFGSLIAISVSGQFFNDSSLVKCAVSSADCKTSSTIDKTGTSSVSIDSVEYISANDPTEYKSRLLKEYQDLSKSQLDKCKDMSSISSQTKLMNDSKASFVDLCNLNSDYLSKSLAMLDSVYLRYPRVVGKVNGFRLADLEKNTYGGFGPQEGEGNSYITTYYTTITFNNSLFAGNNLAIAKKSYERDLEEHFHPKNTSYYAVYTHETGHAIEFSLMLKKLGVEDLLAVNDSTLLDRFENMWTNYTISGPIVKEAVANVQKKESATNKPVKSEEALIKEISGYADQKDKKGRTMYPETIAEAVSDYFTNGNNANALTLEIIPILDREMAK